MRTILDSMRALIALGAFLIVANSTLVAAQVGYRTLTIHVDDPAGDLQLFLSPGDRVDVGGTFQIRGLVTPRVVVQKVTVLAVNHSADDRAAKVASVTLKLFPLEAEKVLLASTKAKGNLVLFLVQVAH
jgi:Flp pilus assembly protein CpaB